MCTLTSFSSYPGDLNRYIAIFNQCASACRVTAHCFWPWKYKQSAFLYVLIPYFDMRWKGVSHCTLLTLYVYLTNIERKCSCLHTIFLGWIRFGLSKFLFQCTTWTIYFDSGLAASWLSWWSYSLICFNFLFMLLWCTYIFDIEEENAASDQLLVQHENITT